MKTIIYALAVAGLLAAPVSAGGPIIEETYEAAPAERDNSWIVPVVIGLLIVGAFASGGGDDAAPDEPQPCKFTGEGGC